ncbi:glucose-6-phosphatase 2 [Pelomyxa schiedti]|nr:glucose-6-phosphatase 2 [Pelomyxa schiedti]
MVEGSLTTAEGFGATPGDAASDAQIKGTSKRDGPVDIITGGASLLQSLLGPAPTPQETVGTSSEGIGIKLLKKMGWREGRGVGARITKKKKEPTTEKTTEQPESTPSMTVPPQPSPQTGGRRRVMGPDIPPEIQSALDEERAKEAAAQKLANTDKPDEEASEDEAMGDGVNAHVYGKLLAERNTPIIELAQKNNFYGIGFDPCTASAEFKEMQQLRLQAETASGTRLSMSSVMGSTSSTNFGLSALEEPDDIDVFANENLSNYDIELTEKPKSHHHHHHHRNTPTPAAPPPKIQRIDTGLCKVKGFVIAYRSSTRPKHFPPPTVPKDFQPFHVFPNDPSCTTAAENEKFKMVTPQERANLLGERMLPASAGSVFQYLSGEDRQRLANMTGKTIPGPFEVVKPQTDTPASPPSTAPTSALPPTTTQIHTQSKPSAATAIVLPSYILNAPIKQLYLADTAKQSRYEHFIRQQKGELNPNILPKGISEWEWEQEKQHFVRDSIVFKPVMGVMADRFVTSDDLFIKPTSVKTVAIDAPIPVSLKSNVELQQEDAARMKMFGRLTRTEDEWTPESLLCKRLNVPNPKPGSKSGNKYQKQKGKLDEAAGFDFASAPTQQHVDNRASVELLKPEKPPLPTEEELLASVAAPIEDIAIDPEPESDNRPAFDLFKEIFENTEDQAAAAEADEKEQQKALEQQEEQKRKQEEERTKQEQQAQQALQHQQQQLQQHLGLPASNSLSGSVITVATSGIVLGQAPASSNIEGPAPPPVTFEGPLPPEPTSTNKPTNSDSEGEGKDKHKKHKHSKKDKDKHKHSKSKHQEHDKKDKHKKDKHKHKHKH